MNLEAPTLKDLADEHLGTYEIWAIISFVRQILHFERHGLSVWRVPRFKGRSSHCNETFREWKLSQKSLNAFLGERLYELRKLHKPRRRRKRTKKEFREARKENGVFLLQVLRRCDEFSWTGGCTSRRKKASEKEKAVQQAPWNCRGHAAEKKKGDTTEIWFSKPKSIERQRPLVFSLLFTLPLSLVL